MNKNSPYLIPRGERRNEQCCTKRTKTNSTVFQRELRAATGKKFWLNVVSYIWHFTYKEWNVVVKVWQSLVRLTQAELVLFCLAVRKSRMTLILEHMSHAINSFFPFYTGNTSTWTVGCSDVCDKDSELLGVWTKPAKCTGNYYNSSADFYAWHSQKLLQGLLVRDLYPTPQEEQSMSHLDVPIKKPVIICYDFYLEATLKKDMGILCYHFQWEPF